MKKILILGASSLQLPAIKKAKEIGIYTIVADQNSNAIGAKYSDEFHEVSTLDEDRLIEIATSRNIDAILTIASDLPMRAVALIGEKLNLNTISVETSKNVTDKYLMRNTLFKKNVEIPKFIFCSNIDQYRKDIKNINFPFIIKPCDNSGSRGVSLVKDSSQSEQAFLHALSNSKSKRVIIEEFMEGREVSVETITCDGKTTLLAITDKLTSGSPYFTELGHSIPSTLNDEIQKKIFDLTKRAINALGINTGPAHTEIIVTSEGPKIVEVGARMGGDNITTHLVPLATGVDMLEIVIRLSLGQKDISIDINNGAAAIRYMKPTAGIFQGINNLDEVIRKHKVNYYEISKGIGENLVEMKSSSDRLGFVICKDNSVEQAVTNCKKIISELNIEIIN